jgi:hypothetical protein
MDDAITLLFLFTATYKIKCNERVSTNSNHQDSQQNQKPFNQ